MTQGSWHLVTGEFPPQRGGVSDYTSLVADGLAASGRDVCVWAPPAASNEKPATATGVTVHRLSDTFGDAGLAELSQGLDALPRPRTIIVQYVPHAFGSRGMNVRFCRWVQSRARARADDVRVMFHEPYYPFSLWPLHRNVLAVANRIMAVLLLSDIRTAYVSTTAWERRLGRYAPRARRFVWLPIPASIAATDDAAAIAVWRARLTAGTTNKVVGHFGTYGTLVGGLLQPTLIDILTRRLDVGVALIGPGGATFAERLCEERVEWRGRITATERLDAPQVAACLRACDVVLQPYADGASGRRTSLMAALVNGVAAATNRGPATESVWNDGPAVEFAALSRADALADAVIRLLDDDARRSRVAAAGAALYAERFALEHTIRALMADGNPAV